MKWFGLLSVVFLMLATLLFASAVAYADESTAGEPSVAIDIRVTGTAQAHVTAKEGSRLEVSAQGAADAHFHFTGVADTVFGIYITGDGEADIDVSGPCQVNIKVEGPAQVSIDAGDEVKLNVQASDESQVIIKGQGIDEPAGDQESRDDDLSGDLDNQSLNLEDDVSRLNPYVVIISAAFPVLGVLTFIIIGLL